jgi:hypothetical protein
MSQDAAGRNHQPAGAPTGGRFATGAVPESGTALALPADPLVGDLGLVEGDAVYLSAFEAGTDILEAVEIVRTDEGGYRADGAVVLDLMDGFHEIARFTDNITVREGPAGADRGDLDLDRIGQATAFLDEHRQLVESFLTDRYGCELDGGCDEWSYQRALFSVDLDPAVDTQGSVASRLESETKAVQLHNESDGGTAGSPYVWRELADHLDRWEEDVFAARRGFAADVFNDQGAEHTDAIDKAADSSPEELDATGAAAVRTFMALNHDDIARAKAHVTARFGEEYTAESLVRDISLAINNPPGTPHGRMAFGALPSVLQTRLQLAARHCKA